MEVLKQKTQYIIQQSSYLGEQVVNIEGRFSELPPEMTFIKASVTFQMTAAKELLSEIDRVEEIGNSQIASLWDKISELEEKIKSLENNNTKLEEKNTELKEKMKSLENEKMRENAEREKEKESWENWRREMDDFKREMENKIKASN